MFDFTFHNQTKIIFGRGREKLIGRELKGAGLDRVLFVYGRESIKRTGLFERVAASLTEEKIEFIEFGGVEPNPILSHTRQGIELARNRKVDAVLAVGGGSVLDEAKAIAVGVKSKHDIWQHFIGEPIDAALPLFTILTLAATGSEMNGNSVVTNRETCQKYSITSEYIYPKVSILNPELTFSVPPFHTACGGVDAIAHVIEGYFTKKNEARLQERLVESIIRTVIDTTGIILKHPADYRARAQFMWAATLALNGLTTAGIQDYTFPNHMIEHALSGLYNIAHGAGLALVIPAWMKWYQGKEPARFKRFAAEIFGLNNGTAGIEALEAWFAEIGMPTRLHQVDIPAADLEKIGANGHGLAEQWGIAAEYPPATIVEILRLAV